MSIFCVSLFLLLFLILLVRRCSGADDYRYESCVEKQCENGPKIKFPFYITREQDPFCGLFMVYCDSSNTNGEYPIIRLSSDSNESYVITSISYENHSFRAHNAEVYNFATNCVLNFTNFTLSEPALSIVSSSSLHMLSNCTDLPPEQFIKYSIPCLDCYGSLCSGFPVPTVFSGFAILGDDENLSYGIQYCGVDVVAPVELHGDEGRNGSVAGNIESLLKRGFALNWTSRDCSKCEKSGGRCGIEPTTSGFRCYCSYGFEYTVCKSNAGKMRKSTVIIVTASSGGGVVVVFGVIVALWSIIRKKFPCENKLEDQQIENFLKNKVGPKRYHYSELKKITNSFDTKLGEGGYGSVYKGKLRDGSIVAVKVLKESKRNNNGEEFINEVESISRTSHVNIVTLLGYSVQGHKKALIYEFMSNGSLEKFIYKRRTVANDCCPRRRLQWPILYKIALGIARGLEYLHRGCNTRILHFDIKPQNILLDEDFCPKISDFGLAKLYSRTKDSSVLEMDVARGTIGFIAPEIVYKNIGGVSHKSDVYSYGMMVLEMVGGRKNADASVDRASQKYFPHWIYNKLANQGDCDEEFCLSDITDDEENKQVRKMLMVSLWCIQMNPYSRPTIGNVLEMLEGPLENIQMPPAPFLYSLSSETTSPLNSIPELKFKFLTSLKSESSSVP